MTKRTLAASSSSTLWKRRHAQQARPGDMRSPAETDLSRIIHSSGLRRLAGVTQIHDPGRSGMHRTRLTHSLEVAQVANGLVRQLAPRAPAWLEAFLPERALIDAISLAHDIGHPPCGHAGEDVLHELMQRRGGFESNAQTLRLITRLAVHSPDHPGLNLSRRTLFGALKYPVPMSQASRRQPGARQAPKCYYDTEQADVAFLLEALSDNDADGLLRTGARTLDAQIVNLADDIGYSTADLEDSIAHGFITFEMVMDLVPRAVFASVVPPGGFEAFARALTGPWNKNAVGALVHHMIAHAALADQGDFDHPLLRAAIIVPPEVVALIECLKRFVRTHVINAPQIANNRKRSEHLLHKLFLAALKDPHQHDAGLVAARAKALDSPERITCDWIASLSDADVLRSGVE